VTCFKFNIQTKQIKQNKKLEPHPRRFILNKNKNISNNMSDNSYTKEDIERMRIAMEGETALDRIKRKAKEEPLVPAGNVTFNGSIV
jgi:hypothetical protein